jgi:hypothetical protein
MIPSVDGDLSKGEVENHDNFEGWEDFNTFNVINETDQEDEGGAVYFDYILQSAEDLQELEVHHRVQREEKRTDRFRPG